MIESPPTRAPYADRVSKNCVFRPVVKSPAQTPYRRKFMCIRHTRPRWCAGGRIRGGINNVARRL